MIYSIICLVFLILLFVFYTKIPKYKKSLKNGEKKWKILQQGAYDLIITPAIALIGIILGIGIAIFLILFFMGGPGGCSGPITKNKENTVTVDSLILTYGRPENIHYNDEIRYFASVETSKSSYIDKYYKMNLIGKDSLLIRQLTNNIPLFTHIKSNLFTGNEKEMIITSLTDAKSQLINKGSAQWTWLVKPKSIGKEKIYLSIELSNATNESRQLLYEDEINIKYTFWNKIDYWLSNENKKLLITALFTFIGGILTALIVKRIKGKDA